MAAPAKSKTPKVGKVKQNLTPQTKAIQRIDDGGSISIDISTAPHDIQATVLAVLSEVMGYHEARRFGYSYPASTLSSYRDAIVDYFTDNYDIEITDTANKYHPFLKILDEFVVEIRANMREKIERGSIEFGDVPYLLERGMEVSTFLDGEPVGGTIHTVQLMRSFFGTYYKIQIKVISNVYGHLSDGILETKMGSWSGLQNIGDLYVHPIKPETKERLQARGILFNKYARGAHYVQYHGQLTRNSWWSAQNFRADGRMMLDIKSLQQVDSNQFSQEGSASGIEEQRSEDNRREDLQIPEDQMWRTYPYLYGFSLSAKQWGRVLVDGVSEIKFREDAFEKLVLPEEDKELVKAIVKDDGNDFSDLIDGKGGGSIFLLHGPPGQGKTLTAEAIAEELKRPLYSISVGELGTSPDSLENTLREILDVATVWNAVLLLDEADIFLEERDEKDIVRNAMVGVFLRLLEYHQGVLFLTTNRVKNIDKAFYSRISIGLRFGEADHSKRAKIWTNLSEAARVEGLDIQALANHDLNGRQIKNTIKLAIKLARAKGEPVSDDVINMVIERTNNFAAEDAAS